MKAQIPEHHQLSYELYQDFSETLDMPVDSMMPLETKYELYVIKIVYLKNLMGQCFRSVNRQLDGQSTRFSAQDFMKIQNSFHITRDLLRECILARYRASLDRAAKHPQNRPSSDHARDC